jgi:hypothetical protein
LEGLRNSPNYFQRLRKKLFAIIRLSLLTFFFTFTYIKRLWDLLIKSLHTLHASKLNLSTKIKDFRFVHIIELIWVDPITCARYYNHKTSCFHKLITKDDYLFGYICRYIYIFYFFFVIEFQNCGSEHDCGFLWINITTKAGCNLIS